MEALVWIGRVVFGALLIGNIFHLLWLNRALQLHLKVKHPREWERIYQDRLIEKALRWPFISNTPVDFLWKSREDFGDPLIGRFRTRIHRSFVGAIVAGIAAVLWFVISEAFRP